MMGKLPYEEWRDDLNGSQAKRDKALVLGFLKAGAVALFAGAVALALHIWA